MKKLIAILALCTLLLVGGCSPKDPGQQTETPLAVTGDVEVAGDLQFAGIAVESSTGDIAAVVV